MAIGVGHRHHLVTKRRNNSHRVGSTHVLGEALRGDGEGTGRSERSHSHSEIEDRLAVEHKVRAASTSRCSRRHSSRAASRSASVRSSHRWVTGSVFGIGLIPRTAIKIALRLRRSSVG